MNPAGFCRALVDFLGLLQALAVGGMLGLIVLPLMLISYARWKAGSL